MNVLQVHISASSHLAGVSYLIGDAVHVAGQLQSWSIAQGELCYPDSMEPCITSQGLFGLAHVDDQVRANLLQAVLEVEHRVQEELRTMGPGLRVTPWCCYELAGIKAVQWNNL